jgi:hypothetical protein
MAAPMVLSDIEVVSPHIAHRIFARVVRAVQTETLSGSRQMGKPRRGLITGASGIAPPTQGGHGEATRQRKDRTPLAACQLHFGNLDNGRQ